MKPVISYKLSVISLFLWAGSIFAQSQSTDTLKMSLQECIDYTLKNNVAIKSASLDEEIAAARVREIRGIGLPQIDGSAGLQHYFKLRNSYLPGSTPFVTLPPGAPAPDVLVLPAIFQLPTNLEASLTATQILFNASYIVGLQAAKTYKDLAYRSSQQTKEQTINNVKKAYFQNLINVERIKLFDINIVRLDSNLKQLKALQKSGFAEQIDVDRLEVTLNNLLTEYEKTINLLVLSSLSLKFQMGMPIEQNIILTDSIGKYTTNTDVNTNEQVDPSRRTEYQLLKLQVKSYQLDLKNNRGAALPSLVAQGSLGAFTSSNNLNLFENRNIAVLNDLQSAPEFKRQPTYWSTYSFVQLGLNVPIFSGLQRSSKVQQSKFNLAKAELNLKNFEQGMNLQVQSAKVNLTNSQRSLKIQERNLALAKNVNHVVFKKYKAGVASNLEVTDAESSLKEAQINYFNALFDFLIFKIDYEQALGTNKN
ncbi:MAG: TolC family protein [Bacteroidota bacterium]|nr:TolC family protein [Bacteroidota bacterium]